MLKIVVLITCLFLSACMVGPNYKEPKTNVASHWVDKNATVRESEVDTANWWSVFHDKNLSDLICDGYKQNLTVQSAGVKVLQVRAQLAQAVGQLYPQQQGLDASLDYYRMGGNYLQNVLPSNFNAATLGFSANWEVDFWGKYRRAILSNNATFLASLAAYDAALVTLTGDIASTYISIRTTQSLIRVTKQNIVLQTESLNLTKARYRAGDISMQDVAQAETELAETQAQLPTLISQLQRYKDALAVLLGIPPDGADRLLLKKYGIPQAPSQIAVGIPKEAMHKRPDVYQARMDTIAQSEAIGATKAELYPALSLAGTFYLSANTINQSSLNDLFNWSSRNITAGPGISWPLLNYGQITNAVRAQDAVFQQSLLNYKNVVLKAQQEVQDNITRYVEAKKAERLYLKAVRSAILATKLTTIRYREGEADYTSVVYAQQQQLRVENALVQAQGEVPQALVAIYRALGGGWQIRKGNDIVPMQIKDDMAARTNWGNLLIPKNHQATTSKQERNKRIYLPNW